MYKSTELLYSSLYRKSTYPWCWRKSWCKKAALQRQNSYKNLRYIFIAKSYLGFYVLFIFPYNICIYRSCATSSRVTGQFASLQRKRSSFTTTRFLLCALRPPIQLSRRSSRCVGAGVGRGVKKRDREVFVQYVWELGAFIISTSRAALCVSLTRKVRIIVDNG